MYIYKRFTIPA